MARANRAHHEENPGLSFRSTSLVESEESPISNSNLERQLSEEEEKVQRSLETLSSKTGMPIITENGHRRFGPPLDYNGYPPPPGSEVFVGKLPRDCFEPELIPILEKVGKIYEMRLIMNLSGRNKGFCFVTYLNADIAERAIRELDNFEIRQGWRIGVMRSLNKRDLFIKDLPKHKHEDEIKFLLNRLAEGIVDICVPKSLSYDQRMKNRGFCFVHFDSHKSAVSFLDRWNNGQIRIFNDDAVVEWADLVPDPYSISVTNLSPATTGESLREIFNRVSNNGVTQVDKKHKRAFIYFRSQPQADLAKHSLNGKIIDGYKMRIKLNILSRNQTASDDQENDSLSTGIENVDIQEPLTSNHNSLTNEQDNSNVNGGCMSYDSNGGSQVAYGNNMAPINPVNAFSNYQTPQLFSPHPGQIYAQPALTYAPQGQIYCNVNALPHLPMMVPVQPVAFGVYGYEPVAYGVYGYVPCPTYTVPAPVIPQQQQPF